MIAKTTALYLLVFVCVLLTLDAGAYAFVQREYAALLQPALATPEGAAAMQSAMRKVALTIAILDVPLILVVGIASYVLARASIAPLVAARERERVFAADAAHELRSPLAAIVASAQAARGSADAERLSATLDDIAKTALDASETVSGLLTLARDPGPAALQCEPVDLGGVVAACTKRAAASAAARGVALETRPQSAIVDGDERRLRELASNLIDNAIRHAHSRVTVASEAGDGACSIVVEDDGPGIPLDEREKIFERFYRHQQDGTGTGLGLAIVRWIATAHRGEVTVAENGDGGARFVASFPAYPSPGSRPH